MMMMMSVYIVKKRDMCGGREREKELRRNQTFFPNERRQKSNKNKQNAI